MLHKTFCFLSSLNLLSAVFILTLLASSLLTLLSRFVQLRAISLMVKLLFFGPRLSRQHQVRAANAIDPRRALLTAMSTTIGIGNIVGPMIAIAFAGPGTLVAYLLATLLGSATTYSEVFFALRYRKKFADGTIQAGPMAYITHTLPRGFSLLYALSGSVLLATWSMSQSHTIAHMLATQGMPCSITGIFLALAIGYAIFNGIHWIAKVNTLLVPLMFILYMAAASYILYAHLDQLPFAFQEIWRGFFEPRSIIAGVSVAGVVDVLRWGLARALQSNEAGVGTSAIPHSLSQSDAPSTQAVLAMASVYTNGLICTLSGLIFLVSGAYSSLVPGSFDASIVTTIFQAHFSLMGEPLILTITFLFAFGTILGNCYNGTRCFAYITRNRYCHYYTLVAAFCIFIGSLVDLRLVWEYVDYLIVPVAITNLAALMILSFREKDAYNLTK